MLPIVNACISTCGAAVLKWICADQERPPAHPTTAKTQPQHPPTQLPPQQSDNDRLGNPPCNQPPHFVHQVLQGGLSASKMTALNSPACIGDYKKTRAKVKRDLRNVEAYEIAGISRSSGSLASSNTGAI